MFGLLSSGFKTFSSVSADLVLADYIVWFKYLPWFLWA
jgi:hypothetical protein